VNQRVFPALAPEGLAVSIGVGGSPESVVRAVQYDLPMMLAIIGGDPARFAPDSKLYHAQLESFGRGPLPISIHSPGHIAKTDEQAIEELWPNYLDSFGRIGRERGWGPITKDHYLNEVQHGSLYVGSPETVARKIANAIQAVGVQRFDLKYSNGPMPHSQLMSSIELYGTTVIPLVHDMLSSVTTSR
jgi:alkanesulfonate monooxygenase SsuD/methylene tetrahydromethanopterin reductase-like flavin-dependent oxidoreductase (luciferase family)